MKDAIDKYGIIISDIIHNSPSRGIAYARGFALGGIMLATLCALWWDDDHDGTPPSSGLLLR